jgi:hypothetical protein
MGAPAAPATASVRAGSVGLYRPRRPRASPLYRLLEEHFQPFSTVYDERFAHSIRPSGERLATAGLTILRAIGAGVQDTVARPCGATLWSRVPRFIVLS